MTLVVTHTTPADGTFSATGAAAWDANHTLSVSGTSGQVQYNNAGNLAGDSGLTYDATNKALTLGGDVTLTRRAAANLRFGAADAAAPVAQTLSVQSVIAGTTNTAGANLTITGSQGTGTGAGGSIIFQTAAAGTTGTTQNALATALQILSSGVIQVGSSTAFQNSIGIGTPALNVGSGANVINPAQFAGEQINLWSTNVNVVSVNTSGFRMASTYNIGWGSGSSVGSPDLFISRRAAANLRFGAADAAAPVAQTLSVQSVVAGTSNTAGANLTITGSQGTGTGAGGSISFQVAPAGSSGSAQNALATAMTIDSVKTVRIGTGYTVATLPAAGTAGRYTYVTDATAPTYLGALIGGGSVVCPVFDNGTAWVSA